MSQSEKSKPSEKHEKPNKPPKSPKSSKTPPKQTEVNEVDSAKLGTPKASPKRLISEIMKERKCMIKPKVRRHTKVEYTQKQTLEEKKEKQTTAPQIQCVKCHKVLAYGTRSKNSLCTECMINICKGTIFRPTFRL